MRKLIAGIAEFRRDVRPAYVERFAHLALGQSPDCLFIACSDSRVVPNVFASTDPGDLFVVRNVGNLVPAAPVASAEVAAIEFAVQGLGVTDVVVCGHSQCGAMKALLDGAPAHTHALPAWLDHGRAALDRLASSPGVGEGLPPEDRLSQCNVLEQVEHLRSHPAVREREARGELTLHAWWFDLAHADVQGWDASLGRFAPLAPLEAPAP